MCPEPLMDQERRYLALLPRISDVRLEGDLLIAADDEGTDILVWRAEPDADDV
jgi:heat shock protein HslJ